MDTQAIDTIVDILNAPEQWGADEFDAIAAVLDAVRGRDEGGWVALGEPLQWKEGRYQ